MSALDKLRGLGKGGKQPAIIHPPDLIARGLAEAEATKNEGVRYVAYEPDSTGALRPAPDANPATYYDRLAARETDPVEAGHARAHAKAARLQVEQDREEALRRAEEARR